MPKFSGPVGQRVPGVEENPGALSAKLCLGSGVGEWALAL